MDPSTHVPPHGGSVGVEAFALIDEFGLNAAGLADELIHSFTTQCILLIMSGKYRLLMWNASMPDLLF